jgi:hypothetical protein
MLSFPLLWFRASILIHVLHRIGEMALAPLVESHLLLYEEWQGKGKAYLFIAQAGSYVYIDLALRAMFPSLHAGTGRSHV